MSKIKAVRARQIIDCKCRPMVEVDIETDDGAIGRGAAPTGSSVGMYEAHVLRDGDPGEYGGMSVHRAVHSVLYNIAPKIMGMDVRDQRQIDETMLALDGTPNKSKLGGNAIYSVSEACLRAAAQSAGVPPYRYLCGREIKTVPVPSFNVANGGRYGDLVQPFNEFLIVPYRAESIYEAVEIAVKCFQQLEPVLSEYLGTAPQVARSYGWVAPSNDPEIVLGLIQKAVEQSGYGDKVAYGLDCASSEMYNRESGTYLLHNRRVKADEIIQYVKGLAQKFPLVFVEDLLDENDWDGYLEAREAIKNTLLIGDDLIATNIQRLKRAHQLGVVDGFVLKPNQVGTVTEALDAHHFAKEHGLLSVPSGRAGGVVGDIVMDFSVGLEVSFQKNGAPRSGERIDKLNFLMRACDLSPGCRMSDLSDVVRFHR